MPVRATKAGRAKGGSGELLIDNRHAPIPLTHQSGEATIVIPAGAVFEARIATCAHCRREVILNGQRTRPRGKCRRCNYYLCDQCAAQATCTFIDELIDLALARPGLPVLAQAALGQPLPAIAALLDTRRIY